MNILLIRPPAKHVKGGAKPSASLPLGLLYIAAMIEKNNFKAAVYDAQINLDQPFIENCDGSLQMGDSQEKVKERIICECPDLVGINCSFSAQIENTVAMAELIKEINPKTIVAVGGNHPSVKPEDFFNKTTSVDIVIMGEGEQTFLEIAESLRSGRNIDSILGTAVKGKINPPRPYLKNLDELPYPAYHLVKMEDYFTLAQKGFDGRPTCPVVRNRNAVSVITSRGCPFDCVFCSIHLHMGRVWRAHSPKYVLEHLNFLKEKYNIGHIHFEDDNLTLDIERFKQILTGIKDLKITWDTPNGVRADKITEEVLVDCKKSGCLYLIIGIESGDQEVLNRIINKHLDLAAVIKVCGWAKKIGLDLMAFFVIGFPGETKINMKKTVDFSLWLQIKYDVLPSVFVATPLPGTRLEKIYKEQANTELSPRDLSKMTQGEFLLDCGSFKADEVKAALKKFYRGYKINFILNCLFFFFKHPSGLIRFIIELLKGRKFNKQLVLGLLEYKNCLCTDRGGEYRNT